MKKQSKKLSLKKKTISNLNETEMKRNVGGSESWFRNCGHCKTFGGNTCPGHKTCYNC